MPIFAWLNAAFLWAMGLILAIHTIKFWNHPEKKILRYSELIEILLFTILGIYYVKIYNQNRLYIRKLNRILFLINILVLIFFLLNVFPNCIKKWMNPNFRANITYDQFLLDLKNRYNSSNAAKKDKTKDFSRKFLHILQFVGYITIHELSFIFEDKLQSFNVSPIEFRNYIYFTVAFFFWIMMMIGDITRMENFYCLPKWAMKWFGTSLEVNREEWTLNSVTPIILANFIWIHPNIPEQIFFIAVWISCISDAMASLIGKNLGKKQWGKKFPYKNKTVEGTLAGIITTIIGSVAIIFCYPVNRQIWLSIIIIPVGCGLIFFLIDVYGNFLIDNLLNPLLSGIFIFCYYEISKILFF